MKEVLLGLNVGDLVAIEFKTPEQIGIVSNHSLAMTRLNPKEANERKINGSVIRS